MIARIPQSPIFSYLYAEWKFTYYINKNFFLKKKFITSGIEELNATSLNIALF